MSSSEPTLSLSAADPQLAMKLALYLTDPARRNHEFSALGSETHTDHPLGMLGLVIKAANEWLKRKGLLVPTAIEVTDTLSLNGGDYGKFIKGKMESPRASTAQTWIENGKNALSYYFFGPEWTICQQSSAPAHVDVLRWEAWQRIARVLFRDSDHGAIPRFFRGQRRSWSGAWSAWEFIYELERLVFLTRYCQTPCELTIVSGANAFPQTDWSSTPKQKDPVTVSEITLDLLRHGGRVNFIFPEKINNESVEDVASQDSSAPARESYNRFRELASGKLESLEGLAAWQAPAKGLSILNPIMQYAHFQMGDKHSLLHLRSLETSHAENEREPLTVAATSTELRIFEEWMASLRPKPEKKPELPDTPTSPGTSSDMATGT